MLELLARYINSWFHCLLADYSGRLAENDEGEARSAIEQEQILTPGALPSIRPSAFRCHPILSSPPHASYIETTSRHHQDNPHIKHGLHYRSSPLRQRLRRVHLQIAQQTRRS